MSSQLDALMSGANQAFGKREFGNCIELIDAVLKQLPKNVPALILRGAATFHLQKPKQALGYFNRALESERNCAPAFLWVSMAERALGNYAAALESANKAVVLTPGDPFSLHQLALCRIDLGDFVRADQDLRRAITIAPNVGQIHHSMGRALQGLGRSREASAAFQQSLKLEPNSIQTLAELRKIAMESYDLGSAENFSRRIVELEPRSVEAALWLARALSENNKGAESDAYLQKALELGPTNSMEHLLLGAALQAKGEIAGAEVHFKNSIELNPEQGSAYQYLTMNRKIDAGDASLVRKMVELEAANLLSPPQQSQLDYGLGKAFEDLGEFKEAMNAFDKANALAYRMKFGARKFDSKTLAVQYETLKRIFSRSVLSDRSFGGNESARPIFVVGMIRSGTTLVEQILSSHPEVGAAGEQRFWLENLPRVLKNPGPRIDFVELRQLSKLYDQMLSEIEPGKKHVVDKMPMNYEIIGLLHLAFPNSKIILTERNPVDTTISIYTTTNRTPITWAHDKENIVFAYQQYEKLVEYWRSILPSDVLLTVKYEELIDRREAVTRQMIEFCGLPWNNATLAPERNDRKVVTPSVWQVRQPVYRTSIDRWRRYGPWLGAFSKLIRDEF